MHNGYSTSKGFFVTVFLSLFFCFVFKIIQSSTDQTLWSLERATAANKHFCCAGSRPPEADLVQCRLFFRYNRMIWTEKIKKQDYNIYMHKQSKPRVIQALVWISVCPLYRFVYAYIAHVYEHSMRGSVQPGYVIRQSQGFIATPTFTKRPAYTSRLSLPCSSIAINPAREHSGWRSPLEAIHMIANNNQNHVCRCTDKIQTNLFNVQKYEYYFEWNKYIKYPWVHETGLNRSASLNYCRRRSDDCCSSEVTDCIHWTDAALGYYRGL